MGNLAHLPTGQALQTSSGRASAARLLEEAFENLSSRAVKAIGPTGQPMNIPVAWPRGRSPSSEEKTALTRIVTSIHAALQVLATEDEMADQIDLLISGRGGTSGAGVEGKARAYALVLGEVPVAILKMAVANILRGKAEGIAPTFLPSTDVVLAYCERLQADVLAKAIMVERMLGLPEEKPPEPISEEKMRENLAKLAAISPGLRGMDVSADRRPLLSGPSPAARVAQELAARRAGGEEVGA